jgi:hypothetical protein
MIRTAFPAIASLLIGITTAVASGEEICRPAGGLVRLPDSPEASGVAAAPGDPVRLFVINDSGVPRVSVLNEAGRAVGTLNLTGGNLPDRSTGAASRGAPPSGDWEDLTVARCPSGTCLFIADIGDNNRARDFVRVYRVPLPPATDATAAADVMELTYPDRPHDAEAMFATAAGDLYIVTKETERARIYKVPAFTAGKRVALMHVATVRRKTSAAGRITDADTSPDGKWVALRTNTALEFFHIDDLLAGRDTAVRVNLEGLAETQGEGVTFGAGGTLYLVGEGGGKGRPGTFARLRCNLP